MQISGNWLSTWFPSQGTMSLMLLINCKCLRIIILHISMSNFKSLSSKYFSRLHFFMPGFAPLTARGSQQYRWSKHVKDGALLQLSYICKLDFNQQGIDCSWAYPTDVWFQEHDGCMRSQARIVLHPNAEFLKDTFSIIIQTNWRKIVPYLGMGVIWLWQLSSEEGCLWR